MGIGAWNEDLIFDGVRDSEWGESVFWSMKRVIAALMLAGRRDADVSMFFLVNA